jgi:putative glutamine amidotransferase
LIGVTAIPKPAVSGFGPNPHETVPEFYLRSLAAAGAAPILLPVHTGWHGSVVEVLDGVVLTGGGDVDPAAFDEVPEVSVYGVDPIRDGFEFDLVRWAIGGDVPLLAICRGMQAMNVALGGSLIQDIATGVPGAVDHLRTDAPRRAVHAVRVERRSLLGDALGTDGVETNSMHHQSVARLGDGLRAVAWSPDEVIEAIEHSGSAFALGVQWHPECLHGDRGSHRIFQAFVAAARAHRSGGSRAPVASDVAGEMR